MDDTTARSWLLRGSAETDHEDSPREEVAALPGGSLRASQDARVGRPDWSSALALIEEATEAIRLGEDRVAELERLAEEQEIRTRDEFAALRDQLLQAQREIEAAYARADAAEQRAAEAHDWLERLTAAINQGFARAPKTPQS